MRYNVSVSSNDPSVGGTVNLNVQVDAPNVIEALEQAKGELERTISAAGLAPVQNAKPLTEA